MTDTAVATSDCRGAAERRPLRVFLVEDSPVLQDIILEDLSTIPGVEMKGVAETERDALAQLQHESYDVIIFDIQLREGNGINLLRSLTRDAGQAQAVKIVLSNHVSSTYRRLCEQYNVEYFFDKTAEFGLLHALIVRLSEGSAAGAMNS